jgi:hypothetical protein
MSLLLIVPVQYVQYSYLYLLCSEMNDLETLKVSRHSLELIIAGHMLKR